MVRRFSMDVTEALNLTSLGPSSKRQSERRATAPSLPALARLPSVNLSAITGVGPDQRAPQARAGAKDSDDSGVSYHTSKSSAQQDGK
ncbi:hypothetical protein MBLNU230_g0573t1 [Neophaeotheca triangularis]